MLQLADKKKKLFFYLLIFILLSTQITKNKNKEKNFNTKINQIEVFGLSDEKNFKVYNNLNFLLFKNIFFINKNSLENTLKKNNLVETFIVKKFYPNMIRVSIKKADYLAITTNNNKKFYIGSNGKLIPYEIDKNFNKKLPFVFSKSNYINFITLKKIIDQSKLDFKQIDSFYYFPSNRWDIKTIDGILIKLPEQNILKSIEILSKIKTNKEFKNIKIIDLRISKNIIITYE